MGASLICCHAGNNFLPAMRPSHPKYTHALGDVLRHEVRVTGDNHIARYIAPGGYSSLRRGTRCDGLASDFRHCAGHNAPICAYELLAAAQIASYARRHECRQWKARGVVYHAAPPSWPS